MPTESITFDEKMRAINCAISETSSVYHDVAQILEINDSELSILYVLRGFGDNMKLKEVIRLSGLCKQTVNSAVRKMENSGTILLSPENGKNKVVTLTEKGKQLAEKTADKVIKLERLVFSGWTKKDLDDYVRLSEKYLHEFKNRIETTNCKEL